MDDRKAELATQLADLESEVVDTELELVELDDQREQRYRVFQEGLRSLDASRSKARERRRELIARRARLRKFLKQETLKGREMFARELASIKELKQMEKEAGLASSDESDSGEGPSESSQSALAPTLMDGA